MDASKVKKVATQALREARKLYGIDPAWEITLHVDGIDGPASANVEMLLDYRRASITVDPMKCSSEREVREFVAHECAHVLLSDYRVFLNVLRARFQGEDDLPEDMAAAFRFADERTTRLLEQLFMRERPSTN